MSSPVTTTNEDIKAALRIAGYRKAIEIASSLQGTFLYLANDT